MNKTEVRPGCRCSYCHRERLKEATGERTLHPAITYSGQPLSFAHLPPAPADASWLAARDKLAAAKPLSRRRRWALAFVDLARSLLPFRCLDRLAFKIEWTR